MRLRTLTINLSNETSINGNQQILKNIHDDLIDDILYIQDIFSLKINRITYILINTIFYYYIMPLLCSSLISQNPKIVTSVVLYIFLAFFYYVKEESFLNTLFMVLFEDCISDKLQNFINIEPDFPKEFMFDWNKQKNVVNKNFFDFIKQNFSEPFIQSIIYMNNSPYQEIQNIVDYFEKYNEENSTSFSSVLTKANFMESLKEQILIKLSALEIGEMESFHKSLSRATGMNVGFIIEDERQNCFLNILNDFMKKQEVGLF